MSDRPGRIQEFLFLRGLAEKVGLSLVVSDAGFTADPGGYNVQFHDLVAMEAYLRGFDHGRTSRGK